MYWTLEDTGEEAFRNKKRGGRHELRTRPKFESKKKIDWPTMNGAGARSRGSPTNGHRPKETVVHPAV